MGEATEVERIIYPMKRVTRDKNLIDIGSTTALSAMVEIIAERKGESKAAGILARQVRAMFERLDSPEDRDMAIEGFCDELQAFFESVPGIPDRLERHERPERQDRARRGRTA